MNNVKLLRVIIVILVILMVGGVAIIGDSYVAQRKTIKTLRLENAVLEVENSYYKGLVNK